MAKPLENSLLHMMVVITSPRGSGSLQELPGSTGWLFTWIKQNAVLRREKISSEDSKHILKYLDLCNMSLIK